MNSRPDWFPGFDQGRLRPGALRTIETARLGEWILTVLRGEDPAIAAGWDSSPSGLLGDVYRSLDAQTRDCFQDAVLELLSRLIEPQPIYPAGARDELLLLAAGVFAGTPRAREPVRYLHRLSEMAGAADPERNRTAWRAVQTLVELGHRGEPRFWRQVRQRGGDSYLGVAFAGFCLFDLVGAFAWLQQESGDSTAALDVLLIYLPLIVEEHGAEHVTGLLQGFFRDLPPDQLDQLRRFCVQLGLRVPESSPFRAWSAADLRTLAVELGLEVYGMGSALQIAQQIEVQLTEDAVAVEPVASAPLAVRVVYAALARIEKGGIDLAESLARDLEEVAYSVCNEFIESNAGEVFYLETKLLVYRDVLWRKFGFAEIPSLVG